MSKKRHKITTEVCLGFFFQSWQACALCTPPSAMCVKPCSRRNKQINQLGFVAAGKVGFSFFFSSFSFCFSACSENHANQPHLLTCLTYSSVFNLYWFALWKCSMEWIIIIIIKRFSTGSSSCFCFISPCSHTSLTKYKTVKRIKWCSNYLCSVFTVWKTFI